MSRVVQKFHMPDFDEYLSRDLGKKTFQILLFIGICGFSELWRKKLTNLIFTLDPIPKASVETVNYLYHT